MVAINIFTRKFLSCLMLTFLLITGCSQQPSFQPLTPSAVIVSFGDSLTYGTGATADTSYPKNLAAMTGHTVINAGIPGEETSGGLKRIKQVLAQYHPQLVIVCLGGNDFLHKKPFDQAKQNLKSIIQIIQDSGAQVLLVSVPAVSINLTVPDFYNELSQEMNVPVINDLATLEGDPKLKSDYIHLNAAGYKALAQAIADYLKQNGAL
jgi:lysophospholipase L1-like esterase